MLKRLIIAVIAGALLLVPAAYCLFHYVFIPQWLIPRIKTEITNWSAASPVKLYVSDINYDLAGGFTFSGLTLERNKKPLLTIKEIAALPDFRQLFNKRLEFTGIKVKSPQIFAKRNARGRWNFEIASKLAAPSGSFAVPFEIIADKIELTDGKIIYDDHAFGRTKLKAGNLSANASFRMKGSQASYEVKAKLEKAKFSYGEMALLGDVAVVINPRKVQMNCTGFTGFAGDLHCFDRGSAVLELGAKKVKIKQMVLHNARQKAVLSGEYNYANLPKIWLKGKVGVIDSYFKARFLPQHQAGIDWSAKAGGSFIDCGMIITDIQKMDFMAEVKGDFVLGGQGAKLFLDLGKKRRGISVEVDDGSLSGDISFAGKLSGEADDLDTYSGLLGVQFKDLYFSGIGPMEFKLGMKVKEGTFGAGIPITDFYGGTIGGALVFDHKKYGVELDIKDADIGKLGETDKRLAGMKGKFTGVVAGVMEWGKPETAVGGGYFDLSNGDLKSSPMFAVIEQGVGKYVSNFAVPDFRKVEGNFSIADDKISVENALCQANGFNLNILGGMDFSGEADFTVGVRFFKQGFFNKTMQVVLIPFGIFNIVTDSLKIKVSGRWPDLKQSTGVQPLSWFQNFLQSSPKYDPDKYHLKDIYGKIE